MYRPSLLSRIPADIQQREHTQINQAIAALNRSWLHTSTLRRADADEIALWGARNAGISACAIPQSLHVAE